MNMRQVRQGVFETNSSSTHSICIAKNAELTIPKSLHFSFGEFGWEQDTLYSIDEKASYLYTAIADTEDFDNILQTLRNKGIDVTTEKPIYKKYYEGNDEDEYIVNGGYVDHSGELRMFIDAVCNDENKLMSYLFSDLSFIITGNDNNESDVSIDVNYEHDEYFKGN